MYTWLLRRNNGVDVIVRWFSASRAVEMNSAATADIVLQGLRCNDHASEAVNEERVIAQCKCGRRSGPMSVATTMGQCRRSG
jgi:hypothetical protein